MQKSTQMLDDFKLKVFMAVVQEHSFTKAAAELGVSQPAVSQNIAELEKQSGMKLFERSRGEVSLTPEGVVFKDYAIRYMSVCEAADNMFSRLPAATVRISVSEELYAYLVMPALESFMKVHPEIVFERAIFEDADLKISLRPALSDDDTPSEAIAAIRMSMSPVNKMGSHMATHEITTSFHVIYEPTAAFSCTRLCRLLKEILAS